MYQKRIKKSDFQKIEKTQDRALIGGLFCIPGEEWGVWCVSPLYDTYNRVSTG